MEEYLPEDFDYINRLPHEIKRDLVKKVFGDQRPSQERKYNDFLVKEYASDNGIVTKSDSIEELVRNKLPGDIYIYTGFEYVRFSIMRQNDKNTGLDPYFTSVLNPRYHMPPQYQIILSDAHQRPIFEMIGADLKDIKEACDILVPYFKINKSDIVYSKQVEIDPKLIRHDIIILSLCGSLPDNAQKITLFINHVQRINPKLANKLCLKLKTIVPDSSIEYTKLYISDEMMRVYPEENDDYPKSSIGGNLLIRPIEVMIIKGSSNLPPDHMAININSGIIIGNNNNSVNIINNHESALISNEKELIKKWIIANSPFHNKYALDYYARLKTNMANQVKHIKLNNNLLHSIISSCGFQTHKYNKKTAWFKST